MPRVNETSAAGAYVITAIRIPRAVHQMLRQMAVERAARQGGRVSVPWVLAELALERRAVSHATPPRHQ
ncbi:hypothetical protein [Pseudomonas sp.]|uniref:hypothetical protein n=1 Tax=Pseudomonas sp. TaxID=306 RepID=UPI0025DD1B4E|nr:hypothetical protein [Pseudomonas sp.]